MGDTAKALGERIRSLRRAMDMTQEALAEKAGLSIQHVGEVERGSGNPTLSSLAKLSKGLEITMAELFDLEHERLSEDELRLHLSEMVRTAREGDLRLIHRIMAIVAK